MAENWKSRNENMQENQYDRKTDDKEQIEKTTSKGQLGKEEKKESGKDMKPESDKRYKKEEE